MGNLPHQHTNSSGILSCGPALPPLSAACMLARLQAPLLLSNIRCLSPLRRPIATMTSSTLAASGRENLPAAEPAAKVQRTEGPADPQQAPTEALRVRRLNEHALLPKRGSAGAAGYDLAR